MSDSGKKSITIRLDEPDLVEWASAQSAAVSSIRMAVKICILQYGKDVDLLDAILQAQFGKHEIIEQISEKNQNKNSNAKPIADKIESDNSQTIVTQNQADMNQNYTDNQNMNQQVTNQQMRQPQIQNPNPQMSSQTTMNQGQQALSSLL